MVLEERIQGAKGLSDFLIYLNPRTLEIERMLDKQTKIIGEDRILFEHIWKTGKGFYITISILGALVFWGLYAYVTQYRTGLGVTGLSRQIFWGVCWLF